MKFIGAPTMADFGQVLVDEQRFQRNAAIIFGALLLITMLSFSLARGMFGGPDDVAAAFTSDPEQAAPVGAFVSAGRGVASGEAGGLRRRGPRLPLGDVLPTVPGAPAAEGVLVPSGPVVSDPGLGQSIGGGQLGGGDGFLPGAGFGGAAGGDTAGGGSPGGFGQLPGAGSGSGAGAGQEPGGGGDGDPTTPTTPTDPTTPTTPTVPTDPTSPLPEPLTWTMMILGVAMAAGALRHGRAVRGVVVVGGAGEGVLARRS